MKKLLQITKKCEDLEHAEDTLAGYRRNPFHLFSYATHKKIGEHEVPTEVISFWKASNPEDTPPIGCRYVWVDEVSFNSLVELMKE